MKNKHLLLSPLLLLSLPVLSQTQHYSKLEIKSKEVFEVGPDNMLVVDTLIMHDKATIKFKPEKRGIIKAKAAYVGKECIISSKGQDGRSGKNGQNGKSISDFGNSNAPVSTFKHGENGESGTNGSDGGDLEIAIHFASLGSLTIDSRGGEAGNGGDGGSGAPGEEERQEIHSSTSRNGQTQEYTVNIPEQPGGDGGQPGESGKPGKGGNVLLTYSTDAFVPVFNRGVNKNGIGILFQAGKPGKHGKPGRGGRSAQMEIRYTRPLPIARTGRLPS